MQGVFTIFPVGQGMFYSGKIKGQGKEFNFVYDCGQDSKNSITEQNEISDLIYTYSKDNTSTVIDMLIISHFHQDHINGINELLKKFKVKNLFIPYYNRFKGNLQIIKVILCLIELGEYDTKIILVPPSSPNNNQMDNNEFNFQEIPDLDSLLEKIDTYSDGENFYNIYKITNEKLFFKSEGWFFDLFNIEISEEEFKTLKKAINEVCIKFGYSNMSDFLRNSKKNQLSMIKDAYCDSISSLGSKYKTLNNTSICLLHCPIDDLYELKPDNITVLTGDIDLHNTTNRNFFSSHFNYALNKVNYFFVPHHGSKGNWDNDILHFLNDDGYFIFCCGVANTYKHPSIEVIKTITQNRRKFIIVNELYDFEYSSNFKEIRNVIITIGEK